MVLISKNMSCDKMESGTYIITVTREGIEDCQKIEIID